MILYIFNLVSGNTLQEVQTFFPNLLAPIPLQLFDSYNHYAMQFEFIVSFSFQKQQILSLISLHSKTILVSGFGDFLAITNFTGPFNGTAFINQDQTITYQSDSDFNASDVLYYRVADQFGDFGIGQLIIDLQGDAIKQIIQVLSDRLVTTMRDQPVHIDLVATAAIERPLTFFLVDPPDNGNINDVTVRSDLSTSVKYTPNPNFVGEDSVTYLAQDQKGIISNIGTIRILVADIPTSPPIARDSQVFLDEDTSIQIQLDAFDTDITDDLTYSIELQPFSGQIIHFDPSTGLLIYVPDPNFNGNDSFFFKAIDQDQLESNIATVNITVNPVNDPPIANSQQLETVL